MAKCEFCGKDVKFGIKVSHSHRRSNRTWKPNVQRVKAIVDGHQSVYMLAPVVCVQVRLPELTDFTDYETAPLLTVELFFVFYQDLNLNHSTERGLTFVWSALLIISLYQPLKDFFLLTKNEHYTS